MHSIAFNRIQHILIATTINIGDKRQHTNHQHRWMPGESIRTTFNQHSQSH